MELKVWVDNSQRIVCGVTDSTTCQDVVYALAHATSQTGRFTLVEKWRSNERILSPGDRPLKVLLKWGEYAGDVQFVLRRSNGVNSEVGEERSDTRSPYFSPHGDLRSPISNSSKEIKKSLTFSGARSEAGTPNSLSTSQGVGFRKETNNRQRAVPQQNNFGHNVAGNDKEAETVSARSGKKIGPPPEYRIPPPCQQPVLHSTPKKAKENGVKAVSPNCPNYKVPSGKSDTIKDANNLNSSHNDEYSHSYHSKNVHSPAALNNSHYRNNNVNVPIPPERTQASHDKVLKRIQNDSQYLDLLHIVNSQKDKMSDLEAEIRKYDSDITYWEENNKKHEQQSQIIEREIKRLEFSEKEQAELILQHDLQEMEKKYDNEKKYEKLLKDEITRMRSDFINCDKEMTNYQEKINILENGVKDDKEKLNEETKHRELKEKELEFQIDELRTKIKEKVSDYDQCLKSFGSVDEELLAMNNDLEEKQKTLEDLVNDMKVVNLESLTLGSTDEFKVDGSNHTRSGSARKILGSPRELENAVPTNKNPHGVWV